MSDVSWVKNGLFCAFAVSLSAVWTPAAGKNQTGMPGVTYRYNIPISPNGGGGFDPQTANPIGWPVACDPDKKFR